MSDRPPTNDPECEIKPRNGETIRFPRSAFTLHDYDESICAHSFSIQVNPGLTVTYVVGDHEWPRFEHQIAEIMGKPL